MAELNNSDRCYRLGDLLPNLMLPVSVAAIEILSLSADSRNLVPGSLFFAVPGSVRNGWEFIDAAVAGGAAAVLCQENTQPVSEPGISWRGEVPVISGKDIFSSIGEAAVCFYRDPGRAMAITGVTGTNGKSTCVFLLAQLQQLLGKNAAVVGTLGYGRVADKLQDTGMTTPDAITNQRILRELADAQVQTVAMEVSSHGLVQKRIAGVPVTTGIFTNLSRDHLDYHGTMHNYAQAKAQLFGLQSLRHAIINLDDDNAARTMMAAIKPGAQLWTYSLCNPAANVYASRIKFLHQGLEAFVRTPWGSGELRTTLLGEFNLYNLLAILTAACVQGADFHRVLQFLPELQPVKGRMEIVPTTASVQVVIDYAHTPDALRQALCALRSHSERKIRVVFGCGGDRDSGKRSQMAAMAEAFADFVMVTSDNPRTESPGKIIDEVCQGFSSSERVDIVEDRATAIASAIASAEAGDIVLIAGKGHEDYQILGTRRLPFDDAVQARLALQKRGDG